MDEFLKNNRVVYIPINNIQVAHYSCVSLEKVEDCTNHIAEFLSLLRILENNQLVHIIENKGKREDYLCLWYYDANTARFLEMDYATQFYKELDNHTINKLPSLQEFIDNNFKTFDEIKFEKEENNREKEKEAREESLKLTRRSLLITQFAVGVTIFIGLGTAIFNYATYKTTREVKITNPVDSIKVLILNPPTPIEKKPEPRVQK